MDIVTSRSNPRVKAVRRLLTSKGRKEADQTIIEGPKAFTELIDAGVRPVVVLRTAGDDTTAAITADAGVEELVVSDDVMESVSDTATPQSPVAVIERPAYRDLRNLRTVVLAEVADPGNVGTILRSAGAFGWDAALTRGTADPWAPKALRAAAGATFGVHMSRVTDVLGECGDAGLTTLALAVSGGENTPQPSEHVALIVGAEADGLPRAIIEGADRRMTIAMPGGRESLNAGVAASIAMFALTGADLAKS